MDRLAHIGDALALEARLYPDKIGAADLERKLTFQLWYRRACRLANALTGIGLRKGDRVCILAYNCLEWLEIYAASALAGLICVPINFRLTGPEIRYIVENCEAQALLVQDQLVGTAEDIRAALPIAHDRFIAFGTEPCPAGFRDYEDLLGRAHDDRPALPVAGTDPWALMYTSGTTGKPKGAIRSHNAGAMLSLVTEVELGLSRNDAALLVMPLCHANSLYFFGAFAYCGAPCMVYSRKSFDPEHLVRTLSDGGATFTSLVPTHYTMMLDLPAATRNRYNVDAVTKLMISSAPARRETKLAIMEFFQNSGLYELYGSTEAGWVTMLHPQEQFAKLGSVGRECVGSRPIRIVGADGNEVADGDPGELYSCNSYTFDGYWKTSGQDQGSVSRRLLHGRRHGPPRRGWLHPSRRPQEQHDHFRRREHLPVRGRSAAEYACRRQGRGHHRRSRPEMGRTRACRHCAARGHDAARRRNHGMVQKPHRRLQAAALGVVDPRRGHAANRDGKNSSPRAAPPARRQRPLSRAAERTKRNRPMAATQDLNADEQSCAAWIARFLQARGIDRIFGLQGGHIQPIWDHVARRGIRIIDVRDEGAAVHMAHAHAELTGSSASPWSRPDRA